MDSDANMYFDPNAYVQRSKKESQKQKVDFNHIEQVVYPQPYEKISDRYDRNDLSGGNKENSNPQNNNFGLNGSNNGFGSGFDLSNLLTFLSGEKNLSSLLPKLLGNLGLNQNVLSLFNNFKPTKKIENKVVENFNSDSISKYRKVEK